MVWVLGFSGSAVGPGGSLGEAACREWGCADRVHGLHAAGSRAMQFNSSPSRWPALRVDQHAWSILHVLGLNSPLMDEVWMQVRFGGAISQPRVTVRCSQADLSQLVFAALPDIFG